MKIILEMLKTIRLDSEAFWGDVLLPVLGLAAAYWILLTLIVILRKPIARCFRYFVGFFGR